MRCQGEMTVERDRDVTAGVKMKGGALGPAEGRSGPLPRASRKSQPGPHLDSIPAGETTSGSDLQTVRACVFAALPLVGVGLTT